MIPYIVESLGEQSSEIKKKRLLRYNDSKFVNNNDYLDYIHLWMVGSNITKSGYTKVLDYDRGIEYIDFHRYFRDYPHKILQLKDSLQRISGVINK